jgi:hypothetical protein
MRSMMKAVSWRLERHGRHDPARLRVHAPVHAVRARGGVEFFSKIGLFWLHGACGTG